jgi:hypothetical protein
MLSRARGHPLLVPQQLLLQILGLLIVGYLEKGLIRSLTDEALLLVALHGDHLGISAQQCVAQEMPVNAFSGLFGPVLIREHFHFMHPLLVAQHLPNEHPDPLHGAHVHCL